MRSPWDNIGYAYGRILDIHGNWDALKAVLADMDRNRIDSRFCLGDCVGYGPEPEEVTREIRALHIPWVMGNHELGLIDPSFLDWFNNPTRTSLLVTRRLLSEDSRRYFKELPPFCWTRTAGSFTASLPTLSLPIFTKSPTVKSSES